MAEEHTTNEALDHTARHERRQNILQQRQTDLLPSVGSASSNGHKGNARQLGLLREENHRLRDELAERYAELERLVAEFERLQSQADQDIATLQQGHQAQVDQYQNHLRDMLEEHRQLRDDKLELEQRFQELSQNYHRAIEQEAHKMIAEAASTIIVRPEHTPALLNDVKKTIELQLRQQDDQHAAQTLYLIRDAQRKAQGLEAELATERQQIASERERLVAMQKSVREQAELRYTTLQKRLQARWTIALAMMTTALLLILPLLQSIFYFTLHLSLPISFFVPILICFIFAGLFARLRSIASPYASSVPRKVAQKK